MGTTLGSYIRERRHQLKLTQVELAERLGKAYSQGDISRLERGFTELPRLETLIKLSGALEVPVENLLIAVGWFTEQDTLETVLSKIDAELDTILYLEGEARTRSVRLQAMIRELQ